MMPMALLWLLLAWGAAGRELQTNPDTCNLDDHHPENNGYYVEGIAGVISDKTDLENGKRFDNSTWAPNTYYPRGDYRNCSEVSNFCFDPDEPIQRVVPAHTCAELR